MSNTNRDALSQLKWEIIKIMREDFAPTPSNWEGPEWHDNAEDAADKVIAAISRFIRGGHIVLLKEGEHLK